MTATPPPAVYEAIKDWACREYGIDPDKVVRPFYPGGDYERFDYSDGKVVVDNPPFSILSKICKFYRDNHVPFFLFAPDLANAIDETVKRVRKEQRRHPPKYAYPSELLTVSRLGKIGRQVEFRVKASDVAFTRALDSQKAVKKAIYGGGYLLSEAKAAELKAAEDVTVWPLSETERRIIENLAQESRG